jgi:hypothetical protein
LLLESLDTSETEAALADIPNLPLWKAVRVVFRADVVRDMHAALAAFKRQLKERARAKENWLVALELQRAEQFSRARLVASYFDDSVLVGTSSTIAQALLCYDRDQRHSVQTIAGRVLPEQNAGKGVASWLRGIFAGRSARREAGSRAELDQRTLDRLMDAKLEDTELNVDGVRSVLSRVRMEREQVEEELYLLWWWVSWRKALEPEPQLGR